MRAMFLEFIDDRTTHHLDQQYMLGPSLLVAPVFVSADEETEYYLPAGRWTSFYNPQRVVQGPTWIKEKVALDDIPLWVRQGSVILLGPEKTRKPDYEYNKALEVRVYELDEGNKVDIQVPTGKGAEIAGIVRVVRKDGEVKVSVPNGSVDLASISYYSSSYGVADSGSGKVAVGKGEQEVVLKLIKL